MNFLLIRRKQSGKITMRSTDDRQSTDVVCITLEARHLMTSAEFANQRRSKCGELIKLRIAIGQLANQVGKQISEINGLFSAIMVEESTLLVPFGGRGEKLGFPAFAPAESHINSRANLSTQLNSSLCVNRVSKSYILQLDCST